MDQVTYPWLNMWCNHRSTLGQVGISLIASPRHVYPVRGSRSKSSKRVALKSPQRRQAEFLHLAVAQRALRSPSRAWFLWVAHHTLRCCALQQKSCSGLARPINTRGVGAPAARSRPAQAAESGTASRDVRPTEWDVERHRGGGGAGEGLLQEVLLSAHSDS